MDIKPKIHTPAVKNTAKTTKSETESVRSQKTDPHPPNTSLDQAVFPKVDLNITTVSPNNVQEKKENSKSTNTRPTTVVNNEDKMKDTPPKESKSKKIGKATLGIITGTLSGINTAVNRTAMPVFFVVQHVAERILEPSHGNHTFAKESMRKMHNDFFHKEPTQEKPSTHRTMGKIIKAVTLPVTATMIKIGASILCDPVRLTPEYAKIERENI